MSILATTDTAVVAASPRLRLVPTLEGTAEVDQLLAQHGAWLRRFVRRRMANPALVDDAVQETLLRVCRSTPPAEPDRVRPWLATVAKRTCVDLWRAQAPATAALDPVGDRLPALSAVVPGSDEHLVAVSERARINRALRQLPPRHRRLLEQQALFGLSYEEIADEAAVSVACVTSALGRARAGFRRRYAADPDVRAVPAWWAAVYRVVDRVRARAQTALGGHAAELAVASVTLGMAAVLVAGPNGSSAEDVGSRPASARAPGPAPSVDSAGPRGHAGSPVRAADAAALAAARAPRPASSSPTTPGEQPMGDVGPGVPRIELTPQAWTVGYGVDVGTPEGTVSVTTGVALKCEGGQVVAVVCPAAAALPGAESNR